MSGKQHKMVGFALGMRLAYHCASIGAVELIVPFALATPFGAMLPDADHPKSKLGSQYATFEDTVTNAACIGTISYIVIAMLIEWFTTGDIFSCIVKILPIAVPFIVCIYLTTSSAVKKKFKFFRKHRGIMHTLIPPLGFLLGYKTLSIQLLANFSLAIGVGYLCHIVCDQETKMGNPLLFPFSAKNIPGLPIHSGSAVSWVAAIVDCILIWMI